MDCLNNKAHNTAGFAKRLKLKVDTFPVLEVCEPQVTNKVVCIVLTTGMCVPFSPNIGETVTIAAGSHSFKL